MEHTSRRLLSVLNIDRIYTAFVRTYDAQFNFPGEHHDMWEIGCVRSGSAGITSGTEIYDCSRNELVIHPAGVFHGAWAKNGKSVSILTVSFAGIGIERFVPSGKFILSEGERRLIELIEREITVYPDGEIGAEHKRESEQIVKNLLEALCLSLHRRKNESAAPDTDKKAALFAEVATYLEKNTDRALTVETVCTECAIGKTVLKELFRAYTGTGVMKYYNCLRVRRAAELIASGLSMAQVSEIMHFSSQNYFSAFFRRETGVSPNKYTRVNSSERE